MFSPFRCSSPPCYECAFSFVQTMHPRWAGIGEILKKRDSLRVDRLAMSTALVTAWMGQGEMQIVFFPCFCLGFGSCSVTSNLKMKTGE